MNPWGLDATGLMVWGLVAHLVADWLFQTERMALGKVWPWKGPNGRMYPLPAIRHAGVHYVALGLVFGPGVAAALAAAHLLIDTRIPTAWWGRVMRQTSTDVSYALGDSLEVVLKRVEQKAMGVHVAIWRDQVFHVVCIAVAALLVAG